jgi:hypothetical protein
MAKANPRWRTAIAYDRDGLAISFVVVRGEGEDPLKLDFAAHGNYILKAAADEDTASLNAELKPRFSRLSGRTNILCVRPPNSKPPAPEFKQFAKGVTLSPIERSFLVELVTRNLHTVHTYRLKSKGRKVLKKLGVEERYLHA